MSDYFYPAYYLTGTGYSDDLYGGRGNDDIFGAGGDDYLEGNAGNDILDGGYGDDDLNGGSGDDWLWAGYGDDVLTGGSGHDVFAFYAHGDFVIEDFNPSTDTLVFSHESGISCMAELADSIYDITQSQAGVTIDLDNQTSITLVGVYYNDLPYVDVGFT